MALSKITSKSIEDGIISADDLAAGSISTAKIANRAVTADKVADSTLTGAKLATPLPLSDVTDTNIIINLDR